MPASDLELLRAPLSSPLDRLIGTFRKWLYVPDPDVILAAYGAIAANYLPGDPVWLLVVGPPGGGKTETIQPALALPDVHAVATLTEPALLSGTSNKERATSAKGGLLREIGDFGIVLCKDFTSVLSMHRDARAQVLAALREIYDGSWTRHVGTDGGKSLSWSGRVGFIAGCTPAIDRHHSVTAAMGERFVLFRLGTVDADEQARRALSHAGRELQMRAELQEAVKGLFPLQGEPRELTGEDRDNLIALATLVVKARSAVERDGHSREIELVPDSEAPTRIVVVLRRLLDGLDALGAARSDAWRVVIRAGLDSIPSLRRSVMNALFARDCVMTTGGVADAVHHPTQTTRRALEDLAAHGVVRRHLKFGGNADGWELTTWARDRYEQVLAVAPTLRPSVVPETSERTTDLSLFSNTTHAYDDISGTTREKEAA